MLHLRRNGRQRNKKVQEICRARAIASAVLLLCALLLYAFARLIPGIFFVVYTPFSRAVSGFLAFLFSFAPISVVEFLLYGLILFFIGHLIFSVVVTCVRAERFWFLLRWVVHLLLAVSVIVSSFTLLWGLNYFAPPLERKLSLDVRERPQETLIAATEWLVSIVNEESGNIRLKEDGSMDGGGFDALAKKIPVAYKALAAKNPEFRGGSSAPVKKVTFWQPFVYSGIAGVYSPFTGESNVNPKTIDAYLPFYMAHEMAHRYGYAAENDANFVAFLVCMESPDAEIRYSGALSAFFYCVNKIYDSDERTRLWDSMPQSVRCDIIASRELMKSLSLDKGLLDAMTGFMSGANDAYLQTMGQYDGIAGYGRMADLVIAQYIKTGGSP